MGINQGPISLDQKYTQGSGHVFLTGIQALVRLPMAQIRRDRAAGLNTAGFVTGYRGSPLGGYDQQLFAARKHLEQYNIKFQPGVNEDPASTAAATYFVTAMRRARQKTAACCVWLATTTARNLPPCRINRTMLSFL